MEVASENIETVRKIFADEGFSFISLGAIIMQQKISITLDK
jgi:hypothetical protein